MKQKLIAFVMTGVILVSVFSQISVQAAGLPSNGKEEVIYVRSDANGNVIGTYVVNIFTDKEITDYGDYSSVNNMNTKDIIKFENGEVNITNTSEKLYYEGTMEKAEIPWDIKIVYKIDGVEYSPEEIAGKSGKLTIKISIKENRKAKTGFFENFALQTTVKLDSTLCKNIESEGATSANIGNTKQLIYTIMPGKEKDIQISSDVTNFEMDSILFNGIKLTLGFDSADTKELDNELNNLVRVVKQLDDGAGGLNSGAGGLMEGSQKLKEGIASIDIALNTLNSRSEELTDGSEKIKKALLQVQSSLKDVSITTEELSKLSTASEQIQSGIDQLVCGLQVVDGSIDSYYDSLSKAGLNDINSYVDRHNQIISSLGITNTQRILYNAYQESGEAGLQKRLKLLVSEGDKEAIEIYENYSHGNRNAISNYVIEAGKMITIETLLNIDKSYIKGSQQLINGIERSLDNDSGELMIGVLSLQRNYKLFHDNIVLLVSSLESLADNMTNLKKGIDTIVSNYNTLDTGVNDYTESVDKITNGYSLLTEGALKMVNGISDLYKGTEQLSEGTSEFVRETSDMKIAVEDKIDSMVNGLEGNNEKVKSFVSDKNTKVNSIQFVIKTSSIKIPDVQIEEETPINKNSFWEKFLHLFNL